MTSHIKTLGKDFLIYGLGASLQMLVGFILLPILTHVFDPSKYGVIDLNSTVIEIYSIIFGLGMTTAVSFFFYQTSNPSDRQTTISTGIIFLLFINFIIGIILFFNASFFSKLIFNSTDYLVIFRYSIIISFTTIFYSYLLYLYRIIRKPWLYLLNTTAKMILDVVLIIFFIKILKVDINGYFLGLTLSWLIATSVVIMLTRRYFSFTFSIPRLGQLLKYGIPLIPTGIALWVLQLVNRFFLVHYTSLRDVGIYGVAVRSTILIILLVNSFKMAWIPFAFSIMREAEAKTVYAKILLYFLIFGTFLTLITALFSKEGISFITTKEYLTAYTITAFLCFSTLLLGAYNIISIGIILVKKTHLLAAVTLIAAGVNIVFNFILIPRFGLVGAATASILAYLSAAVSSFIYSKKHYPIKFELFKNSIVIILGALLTAIGMTQIFPKHLESIVFRVGIICLFPLLLFLLRIISRSEFKMLINIFKTSILRMKIKGSQ